MAHHDSARWRIAPGAVVHLDRLDPSGTDGAPGDKGATKEHMAALDDALFDLQERLYAEGARSLLVVLQAMDAGGKDGAIKHVFGGLNPQGVHVTSFKAPTEEELAHDFLWRVHQHTPKAGDVAVWNRSHYEDVLIVRVHDLVPEAVWRARYEHINAFESLLHSRGTRIVKLYLHISKEEQRKRLQARVDDPDKHWKFWRADLDERARWDDYTAAFEEALTKTSTEIAPWYVVPADHKWFRNWAVSRILIEALEAMDPQHPAAEEEVDGVVVE